ncbi:MAG TPA: lysylphosphatidylglycerol synthase domain-containing protein [Gemmatimonadaceae bacterium]
MGNTKRRLFVVAQWLLAIAIVWYALSALSGQWTDAGQRLQSIRPDWGWILAATALVIATYVLLIETWRRVVVASGERLSFSNAARIWFVSNLGKYVPGKIWSIAAMTMMARDSSVSPGAAAGSSILVQMVSVASGIGVAVVTGAQALDRPVLAAIVGGAMLVALALLPKILPIATRWISAASGRTFTPAPLSASTVWGCVIASVISWVAYGVAFQFFVRGTLGNAAGATTSYIAVYSASYIIGFLALFAPGGAVVRESAIVTGMLRLSLSGQADALAVAIASRLWLTVTELLPGLAYMALGKRASRS